jgi:thiol-disulfide isomerase/thioredoxin
MKIRESGRGGVCFGAVISIVLLFSVSIFGQAVKPSKGARAKLPEVKQIDAVALKEVVKPSGRPLLVNFWATWCEPCREEFPDLVKFAGEYKGRVDFITISLDDLAEIKRDVPAFLASMKADMPAFLLKTPDEDAAITSLALPWRGALPLSVVYRENGEAAYVRPGKIVPATLKAEIEKLLAPKTAEPAQ